MKKDNGVLTGVTEEDLNLLKENSELFWSGVTKIGKFAFSGRINLRSIIIPDCVQMIDEYAFSYCNNLKRIEIPDSVTKIGPYSFRCCTSLEHIHIPDSMKEIGEGAFCSCENLESIVIPSGVKEIESHTFLDCENLESVSLSNGVVTIGERAFNGCVVLDNIVLPDSVKEIEYSAFADCISLENIHISKGATKIDNQSFSSCRSLKNVVIPDGVTEIGDRAFDCCSSLESLVIPKSVTKIGANVFHCCQDLKEITLGCEDGDRTLKVNQNVLESLGTYFSEIKNFVIERDKQKKSFIPAFQIIVNTPKDMVENFYKYSKNWGEFLGNFAKSVGKSPKDVLDEPKADFYKLCLVSGVFSKEQKEREEAKKFIEQNIIGKFGESELHERFAGLQTRENGFNPEYAKFLRINYKENFMIRYLYGLSKNLFAASYNRFSEIQKAYPNREVVTNTDNDRITPKIVENFLLDNKYENVTKETEELAELCGNYGYSQQQFEEVSKWFLKGKKVKAEGK